MHNITMDFIFSLLWVRDFNNDLTDGYLQRTILVSTQNYDHF